MNIKEHEYQIIDCVVSSTKPSGHLSKRPKHVGLVINEELLLETLETTGNVCFDEVLHDWYYKDGKFFYYSHFLQLSDKCRVLLIF